MARKDTYSKKEENAPAYKKILDQDISDVSEIDLIKKDDVSSGQAMKVDTEQIMEEVYHEPERKTFVIEYEYSKVLDDITISKDTNKKKKGAKGIIKKIINNALLKELVALDLLDENCLENLEPYTLFEKNNLLKK